MALHGVATIKNITVIALGSVVSTTLFKYNHLYLGCKINITKELFLQPLLKDMSLAPEYLSFEKNGLFFMETLSYRTVRRILETRFLTWIGNQIPLNS